MFDGQTLSKHRTKKLVWTIGPVQKIYIIHEWMMTQFAASESFESFICERKLAKIWASGGESEGICPACHKIFQFATWWVQWMTLLAELVTRWSTLASFCIITLLVYDWKLSDELDKNSSHLRIISSSSSSDTTRYPFDDDNNSSIHRSFILDIARQVASSSLRCPNGAKITSSNFLLEGPTHLKLACLLSSMLRRLSIKDADSFIR